MKNTSAVMKTTNPNAMAGRFRTVCASMLLLLLLLTLPAAVQAQFPLTITSPPVATNVLGTVGDTAIVKPGQVIGFSVGYADTNEHPLSCLWNFGDGATSSDYSPTHVFTNCGAQNVSVAVSDRCTGVPTVTVTWVAVTCPINVSRLKLQAKFEQVGRDTCAVSGMLTELPPDFSAANAAVTLVVGDTPIAYQLNAHGRGVNSNGNFKLSYNRKKAVWSFTSKLKGDLKGTWAKYGITSGTVINSDVTFPVLFMLKNVGQESTTVGFDPMGRCYEEMHQSVTLVAFDAEPPLTYNNKSGTSGTGAYQPVR
jgi:hypothetical protein